VTSIRRRHVDTGVDALSFCQPSSLTFRLHDKPSGKPPLQRR
jgi:hypothetical protein